MKLKYFFPAVLLLMFFFLVSCKKKKIDPIDESAATTIGNVTALSINSGKSRVKLSWKQPAASANVSIAKYRVFWNNNTDSLELPAPAPTENVTTIINNLTEGNYSFFVYAYNNKGNKSQGTSVTGQVYADKYEASLANRPVDQVAHTAMNGAAIISWKNAAAGAVHTEVTFTDSQGATHKVNVLPTTASTTLTAYKTGSAFSFRTAYLPQTSAIDTFHTAYSTMVVNLAGQVEEDKYASMINLEADGPGDTYGLINRILGGTAYEVPDCGHPVPHITEEFDNGLNKNVFAFFAHVALDDDRCGATDRQRTEIKTYGSSPSAGKAFNGDEMIFKWKFKLDAAFQSSSGFTHIHQIKAGDGTNEDSPLITITPRYGSPDKLEIIHTGNTDATTLGKVKIVDLAPFKGNWIEATEKIKFGTHGTYELVLKKVSDGSVLLSYAINDMDLWRTAATFCRPKWGIYRSLSNAVRLRDEKVLFADFAIGKK